MPDTPGTIKYPTALDSADSLLHAANRGLTALTADLTDSAVTVDVGSTATLPATGVVTIDDERIAYTGTTANTLTGAIRGFDGSVAAAHSNGATVRANIVAAHHNLLVEVIIAVQTKLGIGADIDADTLQAFTAANLRDRTTHTGAQAMSTITGLVAALSEKAEPSDITAAIEALIGGAPGALDTLSELADALANDADYATTITNALALKAPLASPTFTGTVTVPTPDAADDSTAAVNSEWVRGLLATPGSSGVGPDIVGVSPSPIEAEDTVIVTGSRLIHHETDPTPALNTYLYLDGILIGRYQWSMSAAVAEYAGFVFTTWNSETINFTIPAGFEVNTGVVTVTRADAGSDSFVAGGPGSNGTYTVDDTLATPASTGTLTQLLSWIGGRIKAITGKASWVTAPAITLEALNGHKDRHVSGGDDAFISTDVIEAAVKRVLETGGATLAMGAVADGEFLKRVGSAIVGADAEAGSGGGTIPGASINTTEFVLPAANAGGGAAVHSGYLYIFGGAETTTRRREIATGNWTTLSAIPALVSQIGHAIVDGIIYVAGGVVDDSPVNTLYSYNIATDTWSTLATMPADRTAGSLSASATHLYYAGGYNGSGQSGFYAYDIGANSWSTKTSLPSANYWLASTVFGGDVYIAGGVVGGTTNAAYKYSIAGDTWSSALATMPSSREGQEHLWEQDGVLFYIGGYNGSPQPNVYGYDISGNAWSEYPSLPVNINGPMIADAGSIAYIVGGNDGSGALDSVYYITTSDSPSALVGGMINGGSLGSLKGKMKAYDVNGNLIGIVAIYNS